MSDDRRVYYRKVYLSPSEHLRLCFITDMMNHRHPAYPVHPKAGVLAPIDVISYLAARAINDMQPLVDFSTRCSRTYAPVELLHDGHSGALDHEYGTQCLLPANHPFPCLFESPSGPELGDGETTDGGLTASPQTGEE